MSHVYTLKADGRRWNVAISPATSYGYFEPASGEEGGGLWFDGRNLIDYDGQFVLPREACDLLVSLGYHVDADFYPDGIATPAP